MAAKKYDIVKFIKIILLFWLHVLIIAFLNVKLREKIT